MIYPVIVPAMDIDKNCITQDGVKYCEAVKSEVLGQALLFSAGLLVWFIAVYVLAIWLEDRYDIRPGATIVVIGMILPMLVGGFILI